MKATIESTEKIVFLNGIPARIWEGTTEHNVKFHAYITRVAIAHGEDASQFEQELQEHAPPSLEVAAIPLRMIL